MLEMSLAFITFVSSSLTSKSLFSLMLFVKGYSRCYKSIRGGLLYTLVNWCYLIILKMSLAFIAKSSLSA